ncbi:MAG TPA: FkbM family methyltransferase [Candidatus Limnocylindrales bacterium]|nr:FkbM family methyltransferase [Candidatus Limnocylindrales bacterium]
MIAAQLRRIGRRIAVVVLRPATVRRSARLLTRRGFVPQALWLRLPVDADFPVAVPGGSSFLYRSSAGDGVGRALYWRGLRGYEPETVAIFSSLARAARTVVDVGAHAGVFTLLACAVNPEIRVIAFEPVPGLVAALERNLALNGWTQRCDIRRLAAADLIGSLPLRVPAGGAPVGATLAEPRHRSLDEHTIVVQTTTLDAAIGPEAGAVDLVKIDVERAEDRVVRGMIGILHRDRPAIVVECIRGGPTASIEQPLRGLGYRFFHLRDAPVEVDRLEADPGRRWRNYLCLPDSRTLPSPTELP